MLGTPSLYIHWPYCARICPYCDFNVHISKTEVDEAMWVEALLQDLKWQLRDQPLAPLETIYFGGGTPSLLDPRSLERLIDGAQNLWPSAPNSQITLEIHPTPVDQAKLADFRTAGITRVSIGVQSFDDRRLGFLGRDHTGLEALLTVEKACHLFNHANLDLMTALPGSSLEEQEQHIDQAMALGIDHLSVYQLAVEPGTAFGQAVKRGFWQPVNEDQSVAFFNAAVTQITVAGFDHYEVSNFAKPGHQSRHAVLGWQGHGYVGIGPGAEGRAIMSDGTWRQRIACKNPSEYLRHIALKGHGLEIDNPISQKNRAIEQLIFGLRLTDGLPKASPAWQATNPTRLKALIDNGDLIQTPSRICATKQGRLRLDAISDYLTRVSCV